MSETKNAAFIALASVLLAACSALPFNIPPDYRLNAKSGTGVAVFSVSEACPSTMSIKISGPSALDEAIAIDQSKAIRPALLQWRNPCGRVIARELPAGNYQISSFVLVGPGSTYFEPLKKFAIPFAVVPGKASYVGHLKFDISLEQRTYGVKLEDRRDRDLPLLKTLASSIRDDEILVQTAQPPIAYSGQPLRAVTVTFQVVR